MLRRSHNRSRRETCAEGTRPSRYHSVRAISAPFRRPETLTLMPPAPRRIVLVTARFMARRNITRRSSCWAIPSATSCASSSGLRIFRDIDAHIAHRKAQQLGDFPPQSLDVLTFFADHDTGAGRMNRDMRLARWPLDINATDRRVLQLFLQELAHAEVRRDQLREHACCRRTSAKSSRA